MSQTTTRRPDASMSLLNGLFEQSLDPGYAAAAARRARSTQPPRRFGRGTVLLTLGLLAVGILLTVSAAQAHRQLPASEQIRASLVKQLQERTAAANALQGQVDRLGSEVAAARQRSLTLTETGRQVAAQLDELELVTGAAPVVGTGLIVSVNDAPGAQAQAAADARTTGQLPNGIVRDADLQQVVNGLWASGAEAVAVNGYRLTALSAIRSAGQAILVDYRPLLPPYVIVAIGSPDQLQASFAASEGGAYLSTISSSFGIQVDIKRAAKLSLPAAAPFRLDYASTLQESQ